LRGLKDSVDRTAEGAIGGVEYAWNDPGGAARSVGSGLQNTKDGIVHYTVGWLFESQREKNMAAIGGTFDAAVARFDQLKDASTYKQGRAIGDFVGTGAQLLSPTARVTARIRPLGNIDNVVPSYSLNVLNPQFTPNSSRVLQNLTNQVNTDFIANPRLATSVLSKAELDASIVTGVARLQYGRAIEKLVARRIDSDPVLKSLYEHVGGPNNPDFIGKGLFQGSIFDITTPGQVPAHLARPYGQGLNTIIYQRAGGFP
jgi:hypothetical protein